MTLLVSGWVAIDEIETPFDRREGLLGGSAACAALAGALFTDVRLLAAIGEDFPERELAKLERDHLDLGGVRTIEGGQTSRWGGRYHYDMNTRDTLYTHLGVNADWDPVLPKGWEDSETAFLAAGDPTLQRRLIQSLRAPRATMVDTIKFYLETAMDELKATIAAADFISINDSEARELTGTPSVANAGRRLLTSGPRGVLVKLGEYGAVFASEHDYFVAPGYPLEQVVDPTGAGDAFAGAFLGYLDSVGEFKPGDLRRATVYASTVASFQVEGYGPERLLTLTRDEVDARYREFRTLTIFEAGD